MGSNTKTSVVVLILALVIMLLAISANARNTTSKTQPPVPPTAPPTVPPTPLPTSPQPSAPSPPYPVNHGHANASRAKPQPNIKPQSRIIGKYRVWSPVVTGTVYCNCPKCGTPLRGARVQLRCRKSWYLRKKKTATTRSSGRFYIKLPWWAQRKHCKVKLKSAPRHSRCRFKSNVNRGISGAPIKSEYRNLYAVGPFSFTTSPRINCYK